MSDNSDDDHLCGGLFGGEDAAAAAAPAPAADVTFELDCRALLTEGTRTPAAATAFDTCWPPTPEAEATTMTLTLHARPKHHSLWGHQLWNAGRYFSKQLLRRAIDVRGATVLELGAGLGVPSIVAARFCGARRAVVTDYPDADLMEILARNVASNNGGETTATLVALPLLWGDEGHVARALELVGGSGFDVVLLSDLLFNHVCHRDLIKTIAMCLVKDARAAAYCAFSHHRPHKRAADIAFFDALAEFGLRYEKVDEQEYPLMFPDDPGDPQVRAPVHCYRIRHVFDAAGPPLDVNKTYDVVIQGTGMTEAFLSAALARRGLSVLHVDGAPHYGGAFVSPDMRTFVDHVTRFAANNIDDGATTVRVSVNDTASPLLRDAASQRRLLLDVLPSFFLARGDAVDTLVRANAARNLEFQNVDRIALLNVSGGGGSKWLGKAPLTRAEVFRSATLAPLEMRRLMRVVKDLEAALAESERTAAAAANTQNGVFDDARDGESFEAYLRRKYSLGDATIASLTLHGALIAPVAGAAAVADAVRLLRAHMTSVGRFDGGRTPFLAPCYGSAELPQNMCRIAAVWGACFVLSRHAVRTARVETAGGIERAFVTLSNGQKIESRAFVCAAELQDDSADAAPLLRLSRVVIVATRPLIGWPELEALCGDAPEDDAERAARDADPVPLVLAAAPGGVRVLQVGAPTQQAPRGSGVAAPTVLHFTADAARVSQDALEALVDRLLAAQREQQQQQQAAGGDDDEGERPPLAVVFRCSFTLSAAHVARSSSSGGGSDVDASPPIPTAGFFGGGDSSSHVFAVRTVFDGLDDGQYVREAQRVFAPIVRHCAAFGRDAWKNAPLPPATGAAAAEATATAATTASEAAAVAAPLVFLEPLPAYEGEEVERALEEAAADGDAQLLQVRMQQ